jgi:hypothetical protein
VAGEVGLPGQRIGHPDNLRIFVLSPYRVIAC